MKGSLIRIQNGLLADIPPCRTCKNKHKAKRIDNNPELLEQEVK